MWKKNALAMKNALLGDEKRTKLNYSAMNGLKVNRLENIFEIK